MRTAIAPGFGRLSLGEFAIFLALSGVAKKFRLSKFRISSWRGQTGQVRQLYISGVDKQLEVVRVEEGLDKRWRLAAEGVGWAAAG
jgi:hypothetical protein